MKRFAFNPSRHTAEPRTMSSYLTTLLGLGVTLGCPALPLSRWMNEFASNRHLLGYEAVWWAVTAGVLSYVRTAEGRPLSSLGLHKPSAADLAWGISCGLVTVRGLALLYTKVLPSLHLTEQPSLNQLKDTLGWWLFISTVRAAVAEEILFRGYATERLGELTGNINVAALVTWAVFTVEHVGFWGWGHVLVAGFAGGMLTCLYLYRRNLWAVILSHFIVDGIGLLAA